MKRAAFNLPAVSSGATAPTWAAPSPGRFARRSRGSFPGRVTPALIPTHPGSAIIHLAATAAFHQRPDAAGGPTVAALFDIVNSGHGSRSLATASLRQRAAGGDRAWLLAQSGPPRADPLAARIAACSCSSGAGLTFAG
jgi:hypothetical protein